MHIAVCIKQVPDSAQIRVHPVTNTIMRQGVPAIVNPFDLFALEEALRSKDRTGARVAGGWEIAGLDLPVNGLVRSSGRTSGGFLGGSAGVVEESATFNHQGLISSLQSQLAAANANVAKLTKQIKAAKKKKNKAKAKKLTKSLKTAMALIPKINADLAKYP